MNGRLVGTVLVLLALAAAGGFALGRAGAGRTPTHTSAPDPGPTVAKWSGGSLSSAQLQTRVVAMKAAAGLASLDAARARSFADEVLRTAVLAAEARRLGLEQDARVQGPIADLLAHRVVERELEDPNKRPKVSDAELLTWFEAHRAEFQRPERVHLFDLVGNAPRSDAKARKKVRTELEKMRRELATVPAAESASAFAARVRARSDDAESAAKGGDLGPLSLAELERVLGPEGAKQAWLLVELGQLSQPLETDTALHLVRLAGREAGREVTLEQARAQIESRIWYERRDAQLKKYVDALGRSLQLSVDQAELDKAVAGVR